MQEQLAIPSISSATGQSCSEADEAVAALTQAVRLPQEVAPPPRWQVLLLNDDFTPMEFVVYVLRNYFEKDQESAVKIMLQIHHEGKGVCGTYTRDVAATKANAVMDDATRVGHPLQAITMPID